MELEAEPSRRGKGLEGETENTTRRKTPTAEARGWREKQRAQQGERPQQEKQGAGGRSAAHNREKERPHAIEAQANLAKTSKAARRCWDPLALQSNSSKCSPFRYNSLGQIGYEPAGWVFRPPLLYPHQKPGPRQNGPLREVRRRAKTFFICFLRPFKAL